MPKVMDKTGLGTKEDTLI